MRVLGISAEFYNMSIQDSVHTNLVLPTLKRRNEVRASDKLNRTLEMFDKLMDSKIMKAVATLSVSNWTKRSSKESLAEVSNSWRIRAPAWDIYSENIRSMAPTRLFWIYLPRNPIWDSWETDDLFFCRHGVVMAAIPKSAENCAFVSACLSALCATGIYNEVIWAHAVHEMASWL